MANYWNLIVRRCEVGVCVFVFALPVLAATDGLEWLKKRYATLAPKLNGTAFGAPLYIESDDRDGMMRGEVFGILPGAFASFSATLRQLPAWCDLLTLHFNITIKGRGGAMERSVMRYYLGLQALLESRAQPEAQRFEWRVQRWYALTDKYRRQLYELDEEEYLDSKRKERVGWAQLQAEIDGKK